MSDLTLADLRVRHGWWNEPATLTDLIAVLVAEGGEIVEYRVPRNDMLPPGIYGLKPGTYLILRIP